MKTLSSVLMMLCFTICAVMAQTNTGRLIGTVFTPDGVLPGATIAVTDDLTGIEKTVVADVEGTFLLPQLEVGTYTVTVTAQGFKSSKLTNVKINVGQEYTLNVALEIGEVQETVTITAGGEDLINTSGPELSRTVSGRQLVTLPLNGRTPLALTNLQAGVASNLAQAPVINGFRTSTTNIIHDGINVQDNYLRTNATNFSPARASVDNIAEYTISTQASADKGFGGPQIEIVTQRGGNAFTGAAYIYNRNSKFAANNFFNNSLGRYGADSSEVLSGQRVGGEEISPRPFLNRNEFGGRLAGPIIKEKLFFFGFYEGLRLNQQVSQNNTVLTEEARRGIFRYFDNNGVVRSVNLFGLRIVAPNNPAPSAINSEVQSQLLNNLPFGNFTRGGDNLNTTGFRFNRSVPARRNQGTGRIDYQINETNSINGAFEHVRDVSARADADTAINSRPTVDSLSKSTRLALAYRTSPLSNLTNEIRGGFYFNKPEFVRSDEIPSLYMNPTLITNLQSNFQPEGRTVRTYNLQNTVDYVRGNHLFRFGGQFQRVTISSYSFSGLVPVYNFGVNVNTPQIDPRVFDNATLFPGGINPSQRATANNLYALLGGIISSASQRFNVTDQTSGYINGAPRTARLNYNAYAGYFADQWRVTPRLTLNLGLRYDLYSALKSGDGLYLEPVINDRGNPVADLLNSNGRYQPVGGNAGGNNQFFRSDKNNFSPVVGFAYSLGFKNKIGRFLFGSEGKTVLRGGYRFSYINDEYVRAPDFVLANGNVGYSVVNTAVFTNRLGVTSTSLDNRLGGTLTAITTPTFLADRTYADNNTVAFNRFGTAFAIDPNLEIPRVAEYSIGFQRELPGNVALEVRYVGTRSNNLVRGVDFNQIDIRNNGFLEDFNRARSNFLLTGNAACTTAQNPNCQALTIFPQLTGGGLLTNSSVTANLFNGTPADLAALYVSLGATGRVNFLPNANTGTAGLLYNGGFSRYDSLQTEVRRRFTNGFELQANYTFSKSLTNAIGTAQDRFEPFLDLNNQALEVSRADFDQTHVFNLNTNYELPFGKGKRFLNQRGWVNRLVGGFQFTSIIKWASGAPITFIDPRGTLNRAGRSGRQTAVTNLTKDQLKDLIGTYKTPNGVFIINPSVLGRNPDGSLKPGATGRGANGFGSTPFEGQVFFNNAPGQTSSLERAVVNGPNFFNWDASAIKNINVGENRRIQLRVDVFNLLNRPNFFAGELLNINNPSFGQITSTTAPRIIQFAARVEF